MVERVQLSRRKGWRMPPNTVSVARPGRWGNPHVVCLDEIRHTGEDTDEGEPILEGPWLCRHQPDRLSGWWFSTKLEAIEKAVELYRWRLTEAPMPQCAELRARLEGLRGKNLACWCPLHQPCHADVLLELANG
jgi:hypothetical protein